jgi:hypothetical protein
MSRFSERSAIRPSAVVRLRGSGPLRMSFAMLVSATTAGSGCSSTYSGTSSPSTAADAQRATTAGPEHGEGGTPAEQGAPGDPVDACIQINRQRYASRQQVVCGPPHDDGTEPLCHNGLYFADGEYEWQYTDMLISGSYTCEGLQIRAVTPEPKSGHLDPRTGHILWDGVEYVPVRVP